MRYYELMIVMVPEREEEVFSVALDRVNHYISERGGSVLRQERWGRQRRLAYPIKNYNEGNYVLTHMEMEPQDAKELEARLILSEDVLRHLLVRVDSVPEPKVEPPQEAVQVTEVQADESPQDESGSSLEPTEVLVTDKSGTSTEGQEDVVGNEAERSADVQTAGLEDTDTLSIDGETETSSDSQVVVVEDNTGPPAEDQASAIDDESGSVLGDQSVEAQIEQVASSSEEEPTENKGGVG